MAWSVLSSDLLSIAKGANSSKTTIAATLGSQVNLTIAKNDIQIIQETALKAKMRAIYVASFNKVAPHISTAKDVLMSRYGWVADTDIFKKAKTACAALFARRTAVRVCQFSSFGHRIMLGSKLAGGLSTIAFAPQIAACLVAATFAAVLFTADYKLTQYLEKKFTGEVHTKTLGEFTDHFVRGAVAGVVLMTGFGLAYSITSKIVGSVVSAMAARPEIMAGAAAALGGACLVAATYASAKKIQVDPAPSTVASMISPSNRA